MNILKKTLKISRFLTKLSLIVLFLTATGCGGDDKSVSDAPAVIEMSAGSILKGDIAGGTTILVPEDVSVYFSGLVKFKAGSTLEVKPGAVLKGDANSISCIAIERGAKIDAQGSAEKPIIFTSINETGGREAGDWGGIIICGNAITNSGVGETGELGTEYGGTDDYDSSGIIKYVRVEFAGITGIPGIALQGAGSGTIIDYVQVHFCKGDGISVTGGTVNLKHVVSSISFDDLISCKNGWRGYMQFGIGVMVVSNHPLDQSMTADSVIEYENNESDDMALPVTNVAHYNMTLLFKSEINKTHNGVYVKKGAKASFNNSIISAYSGDVPETFFIAEDFSSEIAYDYCYLQEKPPYKQYYYTSINSGIVKAGNNNQIINSEYFDITHFDEIFNRIAPEGLYQNLAKANVSLFAPKAEITGGTNPPDNGFFDTDANFMGAIRDAEHNWLKGWVEFPGN